MSLKDYSPCYQGPYTVEIWNGAKTEHVPSSAEVRENIVSVSVGTVQQVIGGIQFYSMGQPFSWGYYFIRKITGRNGEELWKNWNDKN